MGTITDKINKSIETKEAIRQAIIDKGVDVPANTPFSDYPKRINNIETGTGSGGGGTAMDSFYNVRTSNGTNYKNLFTACDSLTSLDLSNWNTSNTTNMDGMFRTCPALTIMNGLDNWNTSNVTTMQNMFYGCQALIGLDLSNWNTSNVTNMNQMFYSCTSLTELNLSNFDLTKCKTSSSYSNMFQNCSSLHTLRLDNCSGDTIYKIIKSSNFPKTAITGVTRTIYCKEANAAGLTAPTNWVFSYV